MLNIFEKPEVKLLLEAILLNKCQADLSRFLRDVLTEEEIIEVSQRLKVAMMLSQDQSYKQIAMETRLSPTTIARISKWLKNGTGGYSNTISKLSSHHHSPVE